jgi:predicted CXXCH cytochrome family protein
MRVTRRLTRGRDCRNLEGETPSCFGGLLVVHRNMSASHLRERLYVVLLVSALFVLSTPAAASAYWHLDPSLEPSGTREVRGSTTYNCVDCHVTWDGGSDAASRATSAAAGPHGYYRSDTNKCRMCHSVHKAPADSVLLLPAATVQAACFTCHDSSGARGVYHAIAHRGGVVAADHSIDTTKHVPGGSEDLTTQLSCTSCHGAPRDDGQGVQE